MAKTEFKVTSSSSYRLLWDSVFSIKREYKKILFEIENFEFVPDLIDETLPDGMKHYLMSMNTETWAIRRKYTSRLNHLRMSIILFIPTIIEGIILEYHSIKLLDAEKFAKLEKKSLIKN